MLSSVLSLFSASSTERDDPAIACPDVKIGCHVWCIAQHGRLVFAGDANGKIWVWMLASDGSSSTKIDELNAHTGTVYTMCAPREGVLFSADLRDIVLVGSDVRQTATPCRRRPHQLCNHPIWAACTDACWVYVRDSSLFSGR